jgi:hypothetical protein
LQPRADPSLIPICPSALDQNRRARRLPAKVRPARRTLSPLERSDGTKPRKAVSWRGFSKRRTSPISATNVTARGVATDEHNLRSRRWRLGRQSVGQDARTPAQ